MLTLPAHIQPMQNLLPQNARLLIQAGATDGQLIRSYRALYPASAMLVVEADPGLAQAAREYAERVYLVDPLTASDGFYQQLEWADGWFFDGTLEQSAQPLALLQRIRKVIQPDASIVARIANRDYWNAAAEGPRHAMALMDILQLFPLAGFRVASGVVMHSSPLPPAVEAALRQQAAQRGGGLQDLIDAAQPSHYLIKAMPA